MLVEFSDQLNLGLHVKIDDDVPAKNDMDWI